MSTFYDPEYTIRTRLSTLDMLSTGQRASRFYRLREQEAGENGAASRDAYAAKCTIEALQRAREERTRRLAWWLQYYPLHHLPAAGAARVNRKQLLTLLRVAKRLQAKLPYRTGHRAEQRPRIDEAVWIVALQDRVSVYVMAEDELNGLTLVSPRYAIGGFVTAPFCACVFLKTLIDFLNVVEEDVLNLRHDFGGDELIITPRVGSWEKTRWSTRLRYIDTWMLYAGKREVTL